jgi:ribosomal protein S18 acetylase RimI-like enzyme
MAHAEALVAAMASVKGPTLRIWTRPGTAEVRIYFPMKFGYLSVGQDGTLSEMSRGQQTLEVSGMWPAWQALYRKAKKIYLEGLDRRIAAEWAAHEAEVAEEDALLRQREQEKEEQALYEQMLEKAYRNPRRARRNPAKMGPLIKLFGKLKYRVVDESEAFQVVLYDGQKRIGQIQMFRAGPRKVTELRPYCVPMLEELGFSVAGLSEDKYRASSPHYPRVWEVYNVALADEAKGQGFGKLIYEVAMREAYHRVGAWTGEPGPYFLIPNFCSGAGSTSDEAKRVWKSLAREWPSRTTTWTNGFTFTVLHVGHEPVVHEPKAYKAAANPRRPNWRGATQVQSLLFDKALFAPSEARRWAKKHNFVATGLDAGSDAATYLRIRQADPSAFRKVTMRTIELTARIKAVIGVPVGAPTKQR